MKALRRCAFTPVQHWQSLPREDEGCRAILVEQSRTPGLNGLIGVRRPDDGQIGHGPEAHQLFDRLMSGAILSEADAIVCEHIDNANTTVNTIYANNELLKALDVLNEVLSRL